MKTFLLACCCLPLLVLAQTELVQPAVSSPVPALPADAPASLTSPPFPQVWRTRTTLPEKEINELFDKGYFITNLSYERDVWCLVMTKSSNIWQQHLRYRTEFPQADIKKLWDDGAYITNLTFGSHIWTLVMSRGTGYTQQAWRTRSHFPEQEIRELRRQGFYITQLSYE
ncbi:MAG TPA: hypothetical protein PKE63_12100, partial [Lacibacter sp.]|nr:hypothetical protein [Lacibacter sp.]